MGQKVTRREWLKYVGFTVVGLAVGGVAGYFTGRAGTPEKVTVTQTATKTVTQTVTQTPTITTGEKTYKGMTLRVITMDGLPYELIKSVLPEFEERTGAKVNIEKMYMDDAHAKFLVDLTTKAGQYHVGVIASGKMRQLKFGLEPLNEYIEKKDPGLAYFPECVVINCSEDEIWYALPYRGYVSGFVLRDDVFKEKGLDYPTTWDEVLEDAKALNAPEENFYGWVPINEVGFVGLTQFLNIFWCFGAEILDEDNRPVFNSPEAVEALEFAAELCNYAPPGGRMYSDDDNLTAMAQGMGAMTVTGFPYILKMMNPEISEYYDKFKVISMPKKRRATALSLVHMHGINKYIEPEYKELAYEFLCHLCSRESQIKMAPIGNIPVRSDVYDAPELLEWNPNLPALGESFTKGKLMPIIPEWGQIQDVFSRTVVQYIAEGGDAKALLDNAAKEAEKILREAGYKF